MVVEKKRESQKKCLIYQKNRRDLGLEYLEAINA